MYDIHYHVYFTVSLLKYIEPKIRSSVRDLRLLDLMNDRDLCLGTSTIVWRLSSTNHYLGLAGSNPGDSGGECFCETQNLLFGINVGADNLPISGYASLNEVAFRYHSRAHIVPSAFFD
jgi:hypothetical protein